jgi:hypothetical protein
MLPFFGFLVVFYLTVVLLIYIQPDVVLEYCEVLIYVVPV